jgi:anti-sigma factor ChrR (cupin superfamily)
MSETPPPGGDHITSTVGGSVHGQIATGKDIVQVQHVPLTPGERAEVAAMVDDLRALVAREAPADLQRQAGDYVTDLKAALTAEAPDLTTVQLVKHWFKRNLPKVAGALTALFVSPLVGQVIAAGGDALVNELTSDD